MRVALLLLLLFPAVVAPASISIVLDEPRIEGAGLDEQQLFARIDSLEAALPAQGDLACARRCYRLGQLYLSLEAPEYNWIGLEYLERSAAEDPSDFDVARLRAHVLWKMEYERDARLGLTDLTEQFRGDARPYRLLGQLHFRRGRTVLDARDFERAHEAYLGAVQLDPDDYENLHGLAASQLALERWGECLQTAAAMRRLRPSDPRGDFLAAAAFSALGERAAAGECFRNALEHSDEATRAVFEHAEGFLDEHALGESLPLVVDESVLRERVRQVDEDWEPGDKLSRDEMRHVLKDEGIRASVVGDYWRSVNVWPSHLINSRQLLFWQRLVEADVLFGAPEEGGRGWQSWPGRVLARWGRPDRIHYEPPSLHAHHGTWYDEGVRLPVSEDIQNELQLMVWTYHRGDVWFSLLFSDVSLRFRWQPSNASTEAYESTVRTQPMIFFDDEERPRFDLEVTQSFFPRANSTRVENSIAVSSPEGFPPFERLVDGRPQQSLLTVEWAVYDWAEQRIEYVRRELDPRHHRRALLQAIGLRADGDDDALLCQIDAALPPGEYRVAIDVSSPTLGHRSQQMELNVPDADPPGFLSISDLLLAESFDPVNSSSSLPAEFVRYAHAVIPRPSRHFGRGAEEARVYFEVYNLVTDEKGLTHFNVHYRVHRVKDNRVPVRGQVLDPSTHEALELASTSFLEESTGLSLDGHVVKGAAVDLRPLDRGQYLLEIEIEDLLANQSTSRFVRFSTDGS